MAPKAPPTKPVTALSLAGKTPEGEERVPGLVRLWPLEGPRDLIPLSGAAPVTVGRDDACEHTVDEDSVSRRHAELRALGGLVEIVNLGSSNGTKVGGEKVGRGPVMASPGDVVRFGRCTFLVVANSLPYLRWSISGMRGPIVGGPSLSPLRGRVRRFAPMDDPVLVTGETGCGKEVIARDLHEQSRRKGPFVAVNCAAIPDRLFESQFFGHVKGAFTGADRAELGFFRAARDGTLFLDELGELPPPCQPKLLRALEAREVIPLGATRAEPIRVRVVAATNRDLAALVKSSEFRADLFSRIRVLTIHAPPLRERREDVVLLARHFLADLPVKDLTHKAVGALVESGWPGNARELRGALVEAAAEAGAEDAEAICVRHLREELRAAPAPSPGEPEGGRTATIVAALRRHAGNVAHAAKELGLHRAQLYTALRAAGLKAADFREG